MGDTVVDINVTIPGNQHAAPGNQIYQALECGLHLIEIAIDVGMVELDGCKDQAVGKIVQKLGSLIKEGGVVFVAFEDELWPAAELKRAAKVFRNPADKKTGGTLARREQPGQ